MREPKIRPWPCGLHPESGHTQEARPRCRACMNDSRRQHYAEHKNSLRSQYQSFLWQARYRDIPVTISFEHWLRLKSQPCIYQNGPVVPSGIDRRDSRKGYVRGNCQPCCPRHNLMKNDIFTHAQMLDAVKRYDVQCGARTPKRPSPFVRPSEIGPQSEQTDYSL